MGTTPVFSYNDWLHECILSSASNNFIVVEAAIIYARSIGPMTLAYEHHVFLYLDDPLYTNTTYFGIWMPP
jgi:hypothetical protein